jgi:hypothetical protein
VTTAPAAGWRRARRDGGRRDQQAAGSDLG